MALLLGMPLSSRANSVVKISKVSSPVTVTGSTDYTILSASPFTDDGVVDITDTDHSVVILQAVKPSAALKLLSHVKINGAEAKNGTNCQVKLYNRGCIILPYGDQCKPLTVYSKPDFGGTSVNNFGTENSGGYMNTLTAAKLNNQIRSFKLKRGYMVTFSTLPSGRGYSRCFIAADKDLEIATLPTVLDSRISSYRVFKWYDAGKKQIASDTRKEVLNALNVQSCYDWGQGNSSLLPDFEWVPNHIYEDWPSSSTIGSTTQSPHTKNNNEPRNSADDRPQDLATILGNWENMMRTGLRLCSPASWDGSDYWNATGFLAEFLDSIDARGWRCDIIDLHCYWAEGSFDNIHNWVDKYHRPIWISEWVWGASWNNNGAFANGITEAQNAEALKRICPKLNNWDYVERYYYWNSERDPSKIYKDGQLTEAGKYYAQMDAGMAYNGKYDFVPTTPRQYAPSAFSVTTTDGKAVITWKDSNGEYNQLMEVERKMPGGQWTLFATPEQQEQAATYTISDKQTVEGAQYRIHVRDLDGTDRYSNSAIEAGDQVMTTDGRQLYAGGNIIVNGNFELGMTGWTSGAGTPLSQPYFQALPVGGIDGGSYLQAYQSAGMDAAGSIRTVIAIEPGADYLFRMGTRKGNTYEKLSLTADGKQESLVIGEIATTADWERQTFTFNSADYSQAMLACRWLGAAQIAEVEMRRLFATYDEAIADGKQQALLQSEAKAAYDREHPDTESQERQQAMNDALQALGLDALTEAEIDYVAASVQPQSADFRSSTGWVTKAGTYKGGDQRLNTVKGKTCWNAWWSGLNASTGTTNTMEIRQEVANLPEGIYALSCKATTEHYCLTDQHGYMVVGTDTVTTAKLKADYFDLPTVGNIWQTLTTPPMFVSDKGTATIGFVSSKQGATDNAWHRLGDFQSSDKREGWWCATDFELLYHPAKSITSAPGQWQTICLPYAFNIPNGMHVYEVAGLTANQQEIALSEVSQTQGGTPYLYTIDGNNESIATRTLILYEYGQAAETAKTVNNLRGYLETISRAPVGSYILSGNQWKLVTDRRQLMDNYTANLSGLEGLTAFEAWDGPTIPLANNTVGIDNLNSQLSTFKSQQYNLKGEPVKASPFNNSKKKYLKVGNSAIIL